MSISHKEPHSALFFTLPLRGRVTFPLLHLRMAGWHALLCSAFFSQVLAACRGSTLSSAQRWRLCLLWFSGNASLFSHTKLYFPMLHYPTIRVIFRFLWSLAFITPFIQNPRKEEDHSLLGNSWETPIALVNLVFMVCILPMYDTYIFFWW